MLLKEKLRKSLEQLFKAYGITDIKSTANSIGISSTEEDRPVTDRQIKFAMKIIKDHFIQLEEDPDDYEFHLASIWKLSKDINLI